MRVGRVRSDVPELAEVHTIAAQLDVALAGRRVESVTVRDPAWVKAGDLLALAGGEICKVQRWGKRLIVDTDAACAVIGLGMTGRFDLDPGEPAAHTRAELVVGGVRVRYVDPRGFGSAHVYTDERAARAALSDRIGRDAADEMTADEMADAVGRSSRRALHTALLDQSGLAGIGNWVSCEICFRAACDPAGRVCDLAEEDWRRLNTSRAEVIAQALEHGGLSFSDYRDAHGNSGGMAAHLQAYGRAGKPCLRCEAVLGQLIVGGRSVVACPGCQT